MDQAVAPVTALIKVACDPIPGRINCALQFKSNLIKVQEGLGLLKAKRRDVKEEIQRDKIYTKPTQECEHWLNKVEEIIEKVEKMENEVKHIKEKKCFRLLHVICYRMKNGRNLEKLILPINELKDSNFPKVSKWRPKVEKICHAPKVAEETSHGKTMKRILRYLEDENIFKIGVWGPGGVGKTTIIENLNNLPELVHNFDIIIWVKIAKDPLRTVQDKIARRLQLEVKNVSDETIGGRLLEQLGSMKFLLFLDDMWDVLELEELGVPKKKGCKVVITTRNESVCAQMRTCEKVAVGYLNEEEAWEMFCKEADLKSEIDTDQEIGNLARAIVKECGGLPLAIKVVGASMRSHKKDNCQWNTVLDAMRLQDSSKIIGMDVKVFNSLKLSYDRLPDEETKKCFLHCALFPEDYEMESGQLMEYWRNEGYICSKGEIVEDIEMARNFGESILRKLLDASLLQRTRRSNHVKMHDSIRDLALIIANGEGNEFIVKHGNEVKEPEDEERKHEQQLSEVIEIADVEEQGSKILEVKKLKDRECEKGQKISLMNCGISSLPDEPKCPLLTTLLLQFNKGLSKIPDLFFAQMNNLQVLDLSHTTIKRLPGSLDSLGNLRALYLINTYLEVLPQRPNLPMLSTLFLQKNQYLGTIPDSFFELMPALSILNLSFTKIEMLPSSTSLQTLAMKECPYQLNVPLQPGVLENLKELDLSCSKVPIETQRMIPCRMLSQFTGLRKLLIYPSDWKADEDVARELASLSNITTISIHLSSLDACKCFMNNSQPWKEGRLKSFTLYVGSDLTFNDPSLFKCHIAFYDCNDLNELNFSPRSMNKLESLQVYSCDKTEMFISENRVFASEAGTMDVLQHLKEVKFIKMEKLKSFYSGNISASHVKLRSLRILVLTECPELEQLLSLALLRQLTSLEELMVEACNKLKEIIQDDEVKVDDKEKNVVQIPMLKRLVLRDLPALVSIFPQSVSSAWCSLESITVAGCNNLKFLPSGMPDPHHLKKIECDPQWWDALKLDSNTKQGLQQVIMPLQYRPGQYRPLHYTIQCETVDWTDYAEETDDEDYGEGIDYDITGESCEEVADDETVDWRDYSEEIDDEDYAEGIDDDSTGEISEEVADDEDYAEGIDDDITGEISEEVADDEDYAQGIDDDITGEISEEVADDEDYAEGIDDGITVESCEEVADDEYYAEGIDDDSTGEICEEVAGEEYYAEGIDDRHYWLDL